MFPSKCVPDHVVLSTHFLRCCKWLSSNLQLKLLSQSEELQQQTSFALVCFTLPQRKTLEISFLWSLGYLSDVPYQCEVFLRLCHLLLITKLCIFYLFIYFPFRTSVHLRWAALCCAATNWTGMRSKTFSCAFYTSSRACQRVGQPVSVIAIAQITEPQLSLLMIVSPFHHLRGPFCILEQSSSIRPNGLLYIDRVSIEINCLVMTKFFTSNRKLNNKCCFFPL